MEANSRRSRAHTSLVTFFESAELIMYGTVGLLLIVIFLMAVYVEVDSISHYLANDTPILGLKGLFAMIIILELLMTIVGYMKTKSINLGLLLGAGLTAMIRKIISMGYEPFTVQDIAFILIATVILVAAIAFVGDKTIHT